MSRKKFSEVIVPPKVYQEFYCAKSGGGCGGYILVKVNMAINGVIKVICPKCKHEHGRIVQNGHIVESWAGQSHLKSRNDKTEQELIPTMAAYSLVPRTASYLKDIDKVQPAKKAKNGFEDRHGDAERNCPVIKEAVDMGDPVLRESWLQKIGEEQGA